MKTLLLLLALVGLVSIGLLTGCQTFDSTELPEHAPEVDLGRYMGTWYVHGYTPTRLDRNAYNATEKYELDEKGRIRTTYQFRKGSFEGKLKTYRPVGKVVNTRSNSQWSMRFFGVLSAPYLILYVDPDYDYTLVGHPNRKMAWLMSRSPSISDEKYVLLVKELVARDFELTNFVRVPQNGD